MASMNKANLYKTSAWLAVILIVLSVPLEVLTLFVFQDEMLNVSLTSMLLTGLTGLAIFIHLYLLFVLRQCFYSQLLQGLIGILMLMSFLAIGFDVAYMLFSEDKAIILIGETAFGVALGSINIVIGIVLLKLNNNMAQVFDLYAKMSIATGIVYTTVLLVDYVAFFEIIQYLGLAYGFFALLESSNQ